MLKRLEQGRVETEDRRMGDDVNNVLGLIRQVWKMDRTEGLRAARLSPHKETHKRRSSILETISLNIPPSCFCADELCCRSFFMQIPWKAAEHNLHEHQQGNFSHTED